MRVRNPNRDYSDTSGIGGLKHALISPMEQFSLNNLRESPSQAPNHGIYGEDNQNRYEIASINRSTNGGGI